MLMYKLRKFSIGREVCQRRGAIARGVAGSIPTHNISLLLPDGRIHVLTFGCLVFPARGTRVLWKWISSLTIFISSFIVFFFEFKDDRYLSKKLCCLLHKIILFKKHNNLLYQLLNILNTWYLSLIHICII